MLRRYAKNIRKFQAGWNDIFLHLRSWTTFRGFNIVKKSTCAGDVMSKKITRRHFIKTSTRLAATAGLGGCGLLLKGCRSKADFDIVIKNGVLYDGRGGEAFSADIGISGSKILEIGKIPHLRGNTILDAGGRNVCPGFIDVHDHTDIGLLVNPKAESTVRQGITTVISGNCGASPFPVPEAVFDEQKESLREQYKIDMDWRDIEGFFSRLSEQGMAVNYATLVGQGTIRGAVMGFNDRPPRGEEIETMKRLVAENIHSGALGLSSGLEYAPGSFALPDEITELCRAAAESGGVYATHMRDEGDFLLESLRETIAVARSTGVRLQISHFKVAYPRNWSKIDKALAAVESADRDGISIFCDRYPYIAGSTGLSFNFPLWARQGTTEEFLHRLLDPDQERGLRDYVEERKAKLGDWDKVVIASVVTEKNRRFEGRSVQEAMEMTGKDAFALMRDLLVEEKNRVGMVIFMMKEENLKRILSHPLVGIGCDGSALAPYGPLGRGKPHPRHYGSFPRVLGKYIRDEKILPFPEMVKKMTSIPAGNFGFERRGVLEVGGEADIVIWDERRVADKATWKDPHQYPEGIDFVIVNGRVVIREGAHSGELPGRILKHKSARS